MCFLNLSKLKFKNSKKPSKWLTLIEMVLSPLVISRQHMLLSVSGILIRTCLRTWFQKLVHQSILPSTSTCWPINSTVDPEDVILKAFKIFDPENKGVVHKQYICDILKSQADRFTQEEADQMIKLSSIDD